MNLTDVHVLIYLEKMCFFFRYVACWLETDVLKFQPHTARDVSLRVSILLTETSCDR